MTILVQWVHLIAAVTAVGGMAFMLFILMPSMRVLNDEQRAQLAKAVSGRFRWVSWGAIILLIASGIFNIRVRAWEAPWGTYWSVLTLKVVLALVVFTISLLLTLPIPGLESFRAQRQRWLTIALSIAVFVILISAYLRGS
jgi:uncharacterized membrane protein